MKFHFTLAVWVLLAQFVTSASFSNVDQEIFKVNHELKADLGEGIDFYQWLNLPKKAKSSYDEITRAYKKLSVKLHPDKFYQKNKSKYPLRKFKKLEKLNNERYQRLSIIGEILRSDRKQRYDFYLSQGFPKWNGQNFLYSKFKPGLILTCLLVFVIVGVLHYILISLQRSQERKRVESLKLDLKKSAWPNGYPPLDFSDRKLTSPQLDKVFLVKGDGSIYWIEQDDKGNDIGLHLVDSTDIQDVTFRDSLFYKAPVSFWNLTVAKMFKSLQIVPPLPKPVVQEPKQHKPKSKKTGEKFELPNGKVVYGATKAGGRRRK